MRYFRKGAGRVKVSKFSLDHFTRFTQALRIDTKERGLVRLGDVMLGTQKWVLNNMVMGMEDGVRDFVTLKCRQIGISTISLAIDLYWQFKHQGLAGALVTHDEPAREQFRQILQNYYDGLPNSWKQPMTVHNRNHMVFGNRSRLQFKVAGTTARKSSAALGRSSALTFCHATEMSSWADPEGVSSLKASLADAHPSRLYHWESTARGFNLFYDMWEEAKKAVTQRAIFVSFWANELYRAKRHDVIWNSYWGKNGRLTAEERGKVRDVRTLYDVEVDDEEIAWYRWMAAEKVTDADDMMQEFPWTEHEAFIASGSQFFGARHIGEAIKAQRDQQPPDSYRLEFGVNFIDTQLIAAPPRSCNLRIYEEAVPGAQYVLGADPAYGSSTYRDAFALSVWRCYADRIEQVAEFCDPDMATYSFAWALCYLAGLYEPCLVNLEMNGPGAAVLNEINNLRKTGTISRQQSDRNMYNVVRNMQQYLYRRLDSLSGAPNALHWLTTEQSKERMMNAFRDYFERGIAVVRSRELLGEMKNITRQDGAAPSGDDKNKDDRVTGGALAIVAWNDMLRPRLLAQGRYYNQEQHAVAQGRVAGGDVGARTLQGFMKRIGFKPI